MSRGLILEKLSSFYSSPFLLFLPRLWTKLRSAEGTSFGTTLYILITISWIGSMYVIQSRNGAWGLGGLEFTARFCLESDCGILEKRDSLWKILVVA